MAHRRWLMLVLITLKPQPLDVWTLKYLQAQEQNRRFLNILYIFKIIRKYVPMSTTAVEKGLQFEQAVVDMLNKCFCR